VAADGDLLLAALVLFTALGIPAAHLLTLRRHALTILGLSLVPLIVLGATGWALGRPFSPAVQHGLLGTGLSSAEVASVGLVGVAGADATIALGVVTGSLLGAAVLSPLAIGLLSPGAAVNGAALLGRFGLVVVLPLLVGVAIRSLPRSGPWLEARERSRDGLTALAVVALVYAALSGAHGAHGLAAATLAAALFLSVSALLAVAWVRLARAATATREPGGQPALHPAATPGAFTIVMRDFAVAATLATQAFGPRAATVPGVYGVLMLVGGSLLTRRVAVRSSNRRLPAV
jgi:predicted Na+-dependent transporter